MNNSINSSKALSNTSPNLALIRIERPHIFPQTISAGVTERNVDFFPNTGFSLLKGQILTQEGVEEHRAIFAQMLGMPRETMRFQQQVHGSVVRRALSGDPRTEPFIESDGLVSAEQGLTLCVGIADCAAVLLYDPVRKAIGALHSGWRGTKENIVQVGIEKMQELFGTEPASLLAYISPCASGECYIVREDVAQYFAEPVIRRVNDEEYTFDNRAQILQQLRILGVQMQNIQVANGCTIMNPHYHSHRRDGVRAGRMVAFIQMKIEK
jgi:polyphenol oxidase